MKKIILCLFCLSIFYRIESLASYFPIQGKNIITGENIYLEGTKKAQVVVFLSAKCPCSNSHVEELIDLKNKFPNYDFIGVHSNLDESEEFSKKYFEGKKLNFEVIQDLNLNLANRWKAYKTPHAFVVDSNGDILYQGGVSSSAHFVPTNERYLRDALSDIQNGEKVKKANGRTLGCVISRYL